MKTDTSPVYPKPFFELQLIFAKKLADLSQQPLDQALLHLTAFYRIFGLDWSLDPNHPVWRAYVQGLFLTSEQVDWTYQFYRERYPRIPKFSDEEHWGCFAFDYHKTTQAIRLHFSYQDNSIFGPLSHRRVDERKAELRVMFTQIQHRHPDATLVQGGSWLYHWESYKRLFPPAFGQSAQVQTMPALSGRAIWGQFLRRGWSIHQETISLFFQRVSQLERVEDALSCFPYPVLLTSAPISLFYEFYGLV